MVGTSAGRGVIPAKVVRRTAQPVLVDCSSQSEGATQHPISVVPILEGDSIAGFEVRCSCGASVIVECVYEENQG